MPDLKQKKEILDRANYRYHFSRSIYFNREDKKIFSLEAIEDNNPRWLSDRINSKSNNDEWIFFFNADPSEKIKKEILQELKG
jgi:hypothetical protein